MHGRIFSYPDTQHYRLGVNYNQIPVNRCPFATGGNYHRDGQMRVDGNGGSNPNYYPNSFDDIYEDANYTEPALPLDSAVADWYDRNTPGEDDHFSQPGILFSQVLTTEERKRTIDNIVGAMSGISGPKREAIILRQLCHFFRANEELGAGVAKGLGIDVNKLNPHNNN